MSVFIRRFTFDPGTEVLLEIESVNILDLEPPGSITGVGTGVALLVAEFEDGPFNTPTEVTSAVDLANNFGGFGHTYNGDQYNHPCARKRKADGALVAEYWNGNGIVALNGKKFRRLILCRADTSVGSVDFKRCAWLDGGSKFSYDLAAGQTLLYGDALNSWTTTFTAVAAVITTLAGTYPSTFVGGEVLTLAIDGVDYSIVFQAADQTRDQLIARINSVVGYTCAATSGGAAITLSSKVLGAAARIEIKAPTTALVLTAMNTALSAASGSGNVNNIDAVSSAEVDAAVNATTSGAARVRQTPAGKLRLELVGTPLTGMLRVTGGTAADLGFAVNENAAWQDTPTPIFIISGTAAVLTATGFSASTAYKSCILSGAGSYPGAIVGGETLVVQLEGQAPVTVTFAAGDTTQAAIITRINQALGYTACVAQSATITVMSGPGTNSQVVPTGTLVRNAIGLQWLSMQTFNVAADNAGPYPCKVRPALDDGSVAGTNASTVTSLVSWHESVALAVGNPLALSAALSDAAIDATYVTAMRATLNPSSVAAETNLIWSARQSNSTRAGLRQNCIDASAGGMRGRVCAIRPPLGTTTRSMARSNAAQPGVGTYRHERAFYCFPGVQTFMPAIATKGLAGGEGFTADGIIDIGSDGFLISTCSQLPPEENPGQLTSFTGGALGVEKGNPDVQALEMADYTNFRSSGIVAPRMDSGTMIFQSGVTSVDPNVNPGLRNIARRRMADFIQDSLGLALKNFGKKLTSRTRRAAIVSLIRAFMTQLLSPTDPAKQRIDGFKLDPVSGNTPELLALGLFRIILNARTLSSLDAMVLQTTVGESVDVSEAA